MGWAIENISPLYRKGGWGIGNTLSLSRYRKKGVIKITPISSGRET